MMQLKRMLLVEDDPNDVQLILIALEDYGLANDVHVVRDGAEALDYLFRRGNWADRPPGHPAVVVLDIKLPKVDGVEVLAQIRADPELRFMPVVMLTSSSEQRDLVESYQLGANAYVVKPLDFSAFMNAVKQLGTFWAQINEPPPGARAGAMAWQDGAPGPKSSGPERS